MEITGSEFCRSLLAWAEQVRELVARRDLQAADLIKQAIDQYGSERFQLTVLGKAKRGKSTLINALLGRKDDLLAPIDKLPASNAVTRFTWAEQSRAQVNFRAGDKAALGAPHEIPYERISEFVTEEKNPGNVKGVELVEVSGPFADFDHNLVLIDTPGAGSIHEYHDALLQAFIPQSDAVIFLVTARMPLDQDELELLQRIRAADVKKIIFAINKIDRAIDGDLNEAIVHNTSILNQAGIKVAQIHRISAKQAFDGQVANSGIPQLLNEIWDLLATGKLPVMNERLVARVMEAARPVILGLNVELSASEKTAAELETDRRALLETKAKLNTDQSTIESRFLHKWQSALDRFADQVSRTRTDVKKALSEHIAGTSLVGISKLAKTLPDETARCIEAHLQPYTQELEKSLQTACAGLEAEYPALELESIGAAHIKTHAGHEMALGAAGAATAAITSVGLISAAQAASAASVAVVTTPSLIGAALTHFTGTCCGFLTSTTVPVAAPLWVAMAGPIGWTIGGLGALTVPFAWSISKSRQKNRLDEECMKQVDRVFQYLLEQRIPLLVKSAAGIVAEFHDRLREQLRQIEEALSRVRVSDSGSTALAETKSLVVKLRNVIQQQERLTDAR